MEEKLMEQRIEIRQIMPEDYDDIVALQQRCFPGMKPWSEAQFASIPH